MAKPSQQQPSVPPVIGGDDPWLFLQPEGDQLQADLQKAGTEIRNEVGLTLERCFNTPAGRESLEIIRRQAQNIPTFVVGWTTEQHGPCLMRRQAILDMLAWIQEQIRKATA